MPKFITTLLIIFAVQISSKAQIKISASQGTYDSILSGTPLYYQYSWDQPLDEVRDSFKLANPLKAFETIWDSAIVSDGSLYFVSSTNPTAVLIIDGTGWDLMDKGYEDTINFPNISPVMLSATDDEVEWRNFGFAREHDTLFSLPSSGSVKIKVNTMNTVDLVFGDFAIVRPDLCFEGFGSLRPSVTYKDSNGKYSTWFIYGDPAAPTIDTLSDTAFDHLPIIGQKITLDFNKTNFIKKLSALQIVISPNPVAYVLTVQGFSDLSGRQFQIISFDGRVVSQGKLSSNQLNIEQLKAGNYILKIQDKEQFYYARFLKADN